MPYVLIVG